MKSTTLAQFLLTISVAVAAPIADLNTGIEAREPLEWKYVTYADYDGGAPPPGRRSAEPEAEPKAEPTEWRYVAYADYDGGAPPPGRRSAEPEAEAEAEPTEWRYVTYADYDGGAPPPGKRSAEAEPGKPKFIAYEDYPPPGPDKRSAPVNVE
jgi:hypothetical protein